MTCPYCRSQNELDAHRCVKCGRRTQDRIPVQMTAAVPSLETVEMPAPKLEAPRLKLVSDAPEKRNPTSAAPQYQANLFGLAEAARPQADSSPSSRPPFAVTVKRKQPRRDPSLQSKIEFQEAPAQSAMTSLYCDAPVAVVTHRVVAAVIDTLLALSAVGVFAAVFVLAGKEIEASAWPYYAAASALIVLFYRVLFCMMNQDTPGLQITGLHVLDFAGRVPTPKQRWYRLFGGCIGAIAGGIGLMWAVVDEESLTWHDHMSKTFPSPKYS